MKTKQKGKLFKKRLRERLIRSLRVLAKVETYPRNPLVKIVSFFALGTESLEFLLKEALVCLSFPKENVLVS